MIRTSRRFRDALLAVALLAAFVTPLHAAVTTVYNCASSGDNGNHDNIFNGMEIQNLNASNLHTVTLFYSTDTTGTYTMTLTARLGLNGTQVGGTQSKTVALTSGTDTSVTWSFGDATLTPGSTLYFTHNLTSGPGGVTFNLQPTLCAGDFEAVGQSTTSNGFSVAVTITDNPTTSGGTACAANSTTLCIDQVSGDKRFAITSTFATSQSGGESGNGHAIPLSSLGVTEGGLFWYFSSTNPEMLIKVIDGCALNQHFWVFFAATTNVGFHVTVKDTKTGHTATYSNPDLTAAVPVQDTSALVCP
jgi:hypothetical protein